MNLAAASGEDLATLHSNLVLFKCLEGKEIVRPFYPFTFQSGSIQMRMQGDFLIKLYTLHSNLVLFKSTSIMSVPPLQASLHSNLVLFKLPLHRLTYKYSYSLHSNLVLFKSVHIIPPIYTA